MAETPSKAFCIECGEKNGYTVRDRHVDMEVHGTKFSYMEKYAVCDKCGEKVYVPWVNDENVYLSGRAYTEERMKVGND